MRGLPLLIAAAALCAAACSKDDKDKAGGGGGGGGGPPPSGVDALRDAWTKAGLSVGEMTAADGAKYGGGDCKTGPVGGVEVVVCTFATPELAKAAEDDGLEAVAGVTSASALAEGPMLLVVADRRKVDPEGRTINTITKTFRGR